jgi:hypothetical protein
VNPDAWPAPSEGTSREPLPRVEDLPVADQGYDQESVKAAFDSFYRHAAQLDAALRTLEAVDSFHRQASALRTDLRTLRTAGWSQQPFAAPPASYGYGYTYGARPPREGVSPALWRILGEVVLLVAAAVLLGVAKLPWWVIVGVMAAAFAVVAGIEWAASRDRWTATVGTPLAPHPILDAEPAPRDDEPESTGWTAFEEAQEPSDAMTIIGAPTDTPDEGEPAPPPEPVPEAPPAAEVADAPPEVAAAEEAVVVEEVVDEPPPRRRWWRRDEPDEAGVPHADALHEAPRHVRILGPDEQQDVGGLDPWEQGFDATPAAGEEQAEPEEETGEDATDFAEDPEAASRRRFRRR